LETVCLKCLQKEATRRYPSATELADDLGRFLRGEPVVARPVGRLERAWRWCRRNPAVASLLAAFVLALLGGTVVSTFFAVEADQRAREANEQREKVSEAFRAVREREQQLSEANAKLEEMYARSSEANTKLEETLARSLLRPL